MKITAIAVLGLSFFGSVEGSLYAPKPKGTVLRSFESTQMGTPGHAMVASEALEVSNFHRKLGITYESGCDTGNGADQCCYDADEANLAPGVTVCSSNKDIVIPKGTCVGTGGVCNDMGDFTVGEYSCAGNGSCYNAGKSGSAVVASNSCKGSRVCFGVGAHGGEATIGSNSCLEGAEYGSDYGVTCIGAGSNPDGKAVIGDGSCHGKNACHYLGMGHGANEADKKGSATVGKNSCRGQYACSHAGYLHNGQDEHSEVIIGDESCNGLWACKAFLKKKTNGQIAFPSVKIGKNSCNCEWCCMCLIHGDIVPDDSCNDKGSGVNECCTGTNNSYYARNGYFDFTNSAAKTVTVPTAPTPPGSLASQAATTAYAAPAEFDVTLTTSPGCVFAAGTGTIGTITCTFDTEGGAGYTVDSGLYETDCVTTGTPTGVSLGDTPVTPALENGSNRQYISTYVVTLDIANSAAANGNLAFCLKTEVKDKDGDVYDWTGQKIRLAINVDGTFTTNSLSTQTFDGATTAEQNVGASSFGVSINRCDENGGEVTSGTALTVGENFYLCVKGKQSQVIVSNIEEMTAAKTGATTLSLVTATSTGSEGTVNSNTFVYGNGQNQVVIATRLPSTFFATGGTVTFTGSANIVVGARRRLSRSMEVASTSSEESANFSMDIQVAGMDDASSASAIKTTAAMFFAVVVAALIV